MPSYLRKGWGKSRWRRVIKFRVGNEIREGKYWEREESRRCRMCEVERETWEHVCVCVWEGCIGGNRGEVGWGEAVGEVLGEEGEGDGG